MRSVTPPREGQKPVYFWMAEGLKESIDDWLKRIGWDLAQAGRLALSCLVQTLPEDIKSIERLAMIQRVDAGEMLARCIKRGLSMEEQGILASGEALPQGYGKPAPVVVDAKLLAELRGMRDQLQQVIDTAEGKRKKAGR